MVHLVCFVCWLCSRNKNPHLTKRAAWRSFKHADANLLRNLLRGGRPWR